MQVYWKKRTVSKVDLMRVKKESLFNVIVDVLLGLGETLENAHIAAENLCQADSKGINTHGSYLLSPLFKRVREGHLTLPTNVTIITDEAAITVLDGGNGLGPVAGRKAVEIVLEKAAFYGISQILIRNSNNLGSLAHYTEMIAKQGMIGLMSCNAAPAMAPWGGAEPFTGTNPIAVAIYTGKDLLFSADMATSVVARGKIRKAAREGNSIPEGWAIDAEGKITTDPDKALKGTVLPMGGPKGSAIALAVDIISGILAGARHAPNVKSFHSFEGATGVGATLIAVDISKFIPLKEFSTMMDEYIQSLKGMRKAENTSEIFIPGEIEFKRDLDSMENGINLSDQALDEINKLLAITGIDKRLEALP